MLTEKKQCSECGDMLPLKAFKTRQRANKIYTYPYCTSCLAEKNKNYNTINKDTISEHKKQAYNQNRDHILNVRSDYYKNNTAQVKTRVVAYQQAHKEELRESHKKYKTARKQHDSAFRLRCRISSAISLALKKQNANKLGISFLKHTEYSMQELKSHLEKQFDPWMNWDNYGVYSPKTWEVHDIKTWTWNIDHIMPQSKLIYSLMTDDNFKKCWALDNLRPLSSKMNRLKGDK